MSAGLVGATPSAAALEHARDATSTSQALTLVDQGRAKDMLNRVFTQTGLAAARGRSGRLYWMQTFGG